MRLHFLDPIYWRDLLSSYVRGKLQAANRATGEVFAVDQWLLNDVNDEEYNRHLSAVHTVRLKSGRTFVEKYATKTSGARHDYHDLEAYQLALAHGPGRVFAMPTPEHLARASAPPPPGTGNAGGIRMPDGRSFFANRRG